MLFSTILLAIPFVSSLAVADTPKKVDAPITTDNPKRATYQAILQGNKPVQGTITGVSNENGTGVNLNINFFSFPTSNKESPFSYHIHANPVSSDGNCNSTGSHLDTTNVTDTVTCDPKIPSQCQIGDLAGKHGKITVDATTHTSYQTQYLDLYLSTLNTSAAFFGNRSIVVHASNGTRLNCANFVLQDGAGSNGTNGGNASYTPPPTASKSGDGTAKTGKAVKMGVNVALVVGMVGMVFLL